MKAGIVHEKSTFLCASLVRLTLNFDNTLSKQFFILFFYFMQSVLLKDLMTVDMEDLRHTGSSIIGFTILDVKNYELAKTSGEMSQVITYLYYVYQYTYIF